MDFDITFRGIILFGLEIRFYSLAILSGLLAGIALAHREAQRLGEDPSHVPTIAALGAVFGLIGARLYHVIDLWSYYSQNIGQIFLLRSGGIGIFGGIAGSALAIITYVWWVNRNARTGSAQRMRALRWFDIGAPAFLLGQAVGRWGNLFNHELFGPPTDLPWGIPIPEISRPAEYLAETHFHPLFLYESLLSFIGVAVLLWVGRRFARRLQQGDILLLYFVWYSLERSALEIMRFDNWKIGDVPTAHIVSAILIIGAVAAIIWWRRPPYLTSVTGTAVDPPGAGTGRSRQAQRRARRQNLTSGAVGEEQGQPNPEPHQQETSGQ